MINEYKVKMYINDKTQSYLGSIYHADLSKSQASRIASCLNAMFAERGQNWYADIEECES